MDIVTAFVTLLFVMDPLGNVPIFLSILKSVDPKRRQRILARELLIALVVLLIFLWGGSTLLNLLGLRQESVSIAGAIILFLIAIRMIFPSPIGGIMGDTPEGEPFIVPLAIPMVAGPSALAISMLMVTTNPGKMLDWTLALVGAWAATAVILMSAPLLLKVLGNRGLIAVERLMGMVLVMISVQMFFQGVQSFLHLQGAVSP